MKEMSDFMKILGYGWLQRKKTLPPPLPNVLKSMFVIGLVSRHNSNTFNDNYNLIY